MKIVFAHEIEQHDVELHLLILFASPLTERYCTTLPQPVIPHNWPLKGSSHKKSSARESHFVLQNAHYESLWLMRVFDRAFVRSINPFVRMYMIQSTKSPP